MIIPKGCYSTNYRCSDLQVFTNQLCSSAFVQVKLLLMTFTSTKCELQTDYGAIEPRWLYEPTTAPLIYYSLHRDLNPNFLNTKYSCKVQHFNQKIKNSRWYINISLASQQASFLFGDYIAWIMNTFYYCVLLFE